LPYSGRGEVGSANFNPTVEASDYELQTAQLIGLIKSIFAKRGFEICSNHIWYISDLLRISLASALNRSASAISGKRHQWGAKEAFRAKVGPLDVLVAAK